MSIYFRKNYPWQEIVLLLALCVLSICTTAGAGTVQGDIVYAGEDFRRFWIVSDENGLGNVAITLTPRGSEARPAGQWDDKRFFEENIELAMDNLRKVYIPHVMIVRRGTPIKMTNSDPFFHAPRFKTPDSGFFFDLNPGEDIPITIHEEGVTVVKCDNHGPPSILPMLAYILTTDAPFFGISDKNGRFFFNDVPPGDYRAWFWHEDMGEKSVKVTVTEKEITEISLTYE